MYSSVAQFPALDPLSWLYLLVTQYSWVFLFFAVISFIWAQRLLRSISILVAFHRRGPYVEVYRSELQGQSLSFKPKKGVLNPKNTPIDVVRVTVDAEPEIQVSGLRTFSLHHVLEGYSKTVNIRDIPALLAKIYQLSVGVPLTSATSGTSVATSLNTMQIAFAAMGASFPKTKGEYIMSVVYAIAGMGWGIVLGYFIFRK